MERPDIVIPVVAVSPTFVTVPQVDTSTSTATPQTSLTTSPPIPSGSGCYAIPVGPNTPTGIAGCVKWGSGIASHYGPGNGVAMNFCTWVYRHENGCGNVRVHSIDTGLSVVVPVVDFCDCYTGTSNERIVDLQWDVVSALGLNQGQGLYKVEVSPV